MGATEHIFLGYAEALKSFWQRGDSSESEDSAVNER